MCAYYIYLCKINTWSHRWDQLGGSSDDSQRDATCDVTGPPQVAQLGNIYFFKKETAVYLQNEKGVIGNS